MKIKILGSGCARCQHLEKLAREAASELGIEAEFDHVREVDKIMAYPIMTTPALVINEDVKVAGRMPSKAEISAWLKGG
jgi:small redox-active disulfide protein 2